MTNGTRFLSSCTDRLVFVTESEEDLNGSKRFTPECGHNGEKKDAVTLTVQQVTDFVHVDFKIRDLAERKRRV